MRDLAILTIHLIATVASLERALKRYVTHFHEERNHQGLQNRLLKCSDGPVNLVGRVERRERLGGMLNFYRREAA